METITQDAYHKETLGLAATIVEEAKERHKDSGEDIHELISEILHETIDGHEWIIYTYYAQQVVQHSPNDAAIEEYGMESVIKDGTLNWSLLAFCAMEADVREALPDYDEIEDTKEKPC